MEVERHAGQLAFISSVHSLAFFYSLSLAVVGVSASDFKEEQDLLMLDVGVRERIRILAKVTSSGVRN